MQTATGIVWVRSVVSAVLLLGLGTALAETPPSAGRPPGPSRWLLEAEQAQAKGLVLKAVELAGKAVEETPKDPRAWYFRAMLLERARQWVGAEADLTKVLELMPGDAGVTKQRGVVRLRLAEFSGAVADFDRYAELRPGRMAELWERGIALFYARRFDDGRKQFELHRTVNPRDVENSAWHFACVAQLEGFEKARARLLPAEGDTRVPMKEIQSMLAGTTSPDEVLAAAERVESLGRREEARFYARLYVGLYEEARGKRDVAAKHLAEAIRGADSLGIMGDVARLHGDWLAREIRRHR